MNLRDKAFIQGMLDARKALDIPDNRCIVSPFDMEMESEEWDYWWEGYNFHRDPKII
jgi:hypothetical protein